MAEWFEDESIWRDSFEYSFDSATLKAGEQEAEKILKLADFQGGAILDLACGPGRHSIPLAAKGYQVTGVDLTECLLEKAKAAARKAGVQVKWIREDMRRYIRPNAYSLVICMYNSFGYFEDREDDFVTVTNVYESLKPGGAFVLECPGQELKELFKKADFDASVYGSLDGAPYDNEATNLFAVGRKPDNG
jgi:2-polyprenyl-3-methyl-5-hydroxy-6-metoxy-1,4-benzoquinol methylase